MVLLVRIEHVNGRLIGPEILTETTFRELCLYANSSYEPYAVEILSPHEICITYRQGVSLGQVAGKLMAIESWRDFPILITIVIIVITDNFHHLLMKFHIYVRTHFYTPNDKN